MDIPSVTSTKASSLAVKKTTGPLDAMQNVPRVLPWQSWSEWAQVRDALFSNDLSHQAAAIRRISTWRIRGRCPHAVDSTAQLIETRLNDTQSSFGASSSVSDQPLRTCYAMCVVRAVNGIVDGGQRGAQAMSIQKLARRVGLPVWVVELRHDATHNNLPHLPLLRLALDTILNWFYKEYWEAQSKFLSDIDMLCQGILRRFDKGGRGEGHRSGVDDSALRAALTDLPNSTLANMFIPLLLSDSSQRAGGHHFFQQVNPLSIHGTAVSGTILVPFSSQYQISDETTIERLYFRVLPLLEALQAQWSGFSESLLTQIVESIVTCSSIDSAEQENVDDQRRKYNETQLFFLLAWVKLLLSRDWICRLLVASAPVESSTSASESSNNSSLKAKDETETFIKFKDETNMEKESEKHSNLGSNKHEDIVQTMLANEISKYAGEKESNDNNNGQRKKLKVASLSSKKGSVLRLTPHHDWSSSQTKFMLETCPLKFFEDAKFLKVTRSAKSNTSTYDECLLEGGDTCVAIRLIKLALWLSNHKLSTRRYGRLEHVDTKLSELIRILKAPVSTPPNEETSTTTPSTIAQYPSSQVLGQKGTETDACKEGTWELVFDWVPCPIGSLPGTISSTLDVL